MAFQTWRGLALLLPAGAERAGVFATGLGYVGDWTEGGYRTLKLWAGGHASAVKPAFQLDFQLTFLVWMSLTHRLPAPCIAVGPGARRWESQYLLC